MYQNPPSVHYNAIVIGVGSMGSSTCWFLAQRGYRVLGIERFGIAHEFGSHGGQKQNYSKSLFQAIVEDPERGTFYGFPILPANSFDGHIGLKLDHHHPGEITEADQLPDNIPADAEENIRYVLKKYLHGAGVNMISIKTCLYTYSKDTNFIIDHLPGYDKRVAIACGFSGHGFKFVSVVGEILADLAMKGKTELPIGFLKLRPF